MKRFAALLLTLSCLTGCQSAGTWFPEFLVDTAIGSIFYESDKDPWERQERLDKERQDFASYPAHDIANR